ncbi:MAG: protease complex subunit PrcB family protein [Pseudomonadota bacterium]
MRATAYPGFVTLGATAAFGLCACNDNESLASINDPAPVAYKVIAQGAGVGGSAGEQYRLVESQAELEMAFNAVGPRSGVMPPTIDFTQEVAYFATLGSRPSTGYGISVEGLRRASNRDAAGDALEVDIGVFSPGPGCFNAAVMTAPYVIISIPRAAVSRDVINVNRSEKLGHC